MTKPNSSSVIQQWFHDPFQRCFFIAEIGVNHNGDVTLAKKLIDVAVDAGADAVKFQTFFAKELVTRDAKKAAYQERNTQDDSSQFEMLKALELTAEEFKELRLYCDSKGIEFLSTPFSENAADLLEDIEVGGVKVSSGDLTHLALLKHMAQKGRPMIVSTGMGNMAEIERAVNTIRANGNPPLVLLHCVSNYPADVADCNLNAMSTMADAFEVPVGWSDHTEGQTITLAAVAMGAVAIEKHYTLDRQLPGPDHAASLEPDELASLITSVRQVELAKGSKMKAPTVAEQETALVARRSLVAKNALAVGQTITELDLDYRRPGIGIPPHMVQMVIGSTVKNTIDEGCLIELKDLVFS